MHTLDGWDGWDGGENAAAGDGGTAHDGSTATALTRSREALVQGPLPALTRPAGWPGLQAGDALLDLDSSVRQQLVLLDLLRGLSMQVPAPSALTPLSVVLQHGRMQHQVSAAGIDWQAELALVEAKADLRAERAAEINAQRHHNPAFWANLLPISARRTPYTLELMQVGVAFSAMVVQRVKVVLQVPRPSALSPRIQPSLPTPGHASYPSGHATQAALLAGLLWVLVNRRGAPPAWGSVLKPMLDALAARIAENREVAGLHFAVDSEAGKALGDKLLAAMLEAKAQTVDPQRPQDGHTLAWLWQRAAAEWGGP